MSITLLILAMALVTYLPRALPAALIGKLKFSPQAEKFLRLIPYTAMAALIFPGVLNVDPQLWYIGAAGGLTALVLAWYRRSVLLVVAAAVLTDVLLYLL